MGGGGRWREGGVERERGGRGGVEREGRRERGRSREGEGGRNRYTLRQYSNKALEEVLPNSITIDRACWVHVLS